MSCATCPSSTIVSKSGVSREGFHAIDFNSMPNIPSKYFFSKGRVTSRITLNTSDVTSDEMSTSASASAHKTQLRSA